ncbi:nickel pincer cofactor biosynthesis protein LarC [Nodosilinea sp. P-1105]|uniref:nickel pincer cofactor biosynthesis protein LarC n=1 Tax=Nodosilinea sp. P-1105 TaxID=2546229 RepID=UPI00146C42C8|nr:nickel pincer cofactor biosynthesis protein LarC [Nodosilinea sp. P-1105]NMF83678.1 nickel pincer cofactor biosynthesis protein LarC [Nodosilinea sp. P-1105]
MKTIAYLDCVTGVSGDMCLAALIDGGVPLTYLQTQLSSLGLDAEFTLATADVQRQGQRALKVDVQLTSSPGQAPSSSSPPDHAPLDHSHGHNHQQVIAHTAATTTTARPRPPVRNLPAIEQIITRAALPDRVRHWSLAVFRHLAQAEAAVHGIPLDQVHFHEVGATDAIVDIVGTCLGFDYLNIDTLICSPLPTGQGRVKAAHGWLPVPAPAVLQLLAMAQVPIYSHDLPGELVTPTGAALVTTLAQEFGSPPAMVLERVGLGAGGKALPMPNVLRLWLGRAVNPSSPQPGAKPVELPPPVPQETIILLETQVDDMVPQTVGYLHERLFAAGAVDVFTQPVAMKKNRPGLLITVLCLPEIETLCTDILFKETPTLGVRRQEQQRTVLRRDIRPITTPYGTVAIKLAYHPHTQALVNAHPEYEDCAKLARHYDIPWKTVYQTALSTWQQQMTGSPTPSVNHLPLSP